MPIRDIKVLNPGETTVKWRYLVPATSIFIILVFQTFHFGVVQFIWTPDKPAVNRKTCTCGCWDTIFKGTYENQPVHYKHFYFNSTRNTLKIWVLTVVCLISLYETLKFLLRLAIQRKLRFSMLTLFISVFYSHYYSWWNYCNYLNDDFYLQWYHQLYFSITELASTVLVIGLCNKDAPLVPSKLMIIISIAVTHILVSGVDQFVYNVLFGAGKRFQIYRDVGFMLPDLLHVMVPFFLLVKLSVECGMKLNDLVSRKLLISCLLGIAFATMFAKFVVFEQGLNNPRTRTNLF